MRMSRPGTTLLLCVLGLAFLLIVAAWLIPGDLELQITWVNENKIILSLPFKPEERFTIRYTHSVENAPIWETHSMDEKGNIYIEEERYEKFGAGMGKMPGVGRMVTKGIYEVITDMHMPTGDFILRVGSPGVDHTLIWRDRQINFSETMAHQAIRFSGTTRSMLYHLWRAVRHPAPANGIIRIKTRYPEGNNG